MKFQIYSDDQFLTKAVNLGGCGINPNEIQQEQKHGTYWFSYHSGYHGDGGRHYVYVQDKNPPKKNLYRIFIDAPHSPSGNQGTLKTRELNDALSVVQANNELFHHIVENIG